MQYKEVTEGYTFIQTESGDIKVYDTVGDISNLDPVYVSSRSVKSQKEFEIEISYILQEDLHKNASQHNFYD